MGGLVLWVVFQSPTNIKLLVGLEKGSAIRVHVWELSLDLACVDLEFLEFTEQVVIKT